MLTDEWLDAELRQLASHVTFPPTPDLVPGVLERVERRRRSGWFPRPAWRLGAVVAIVATLLIAATAAAIAFGLPGLRIILVRDAPMASDVGEDLALGEATDIADAAARFRGPLAVPESIGQPDEVYLAADGSLVSLVYHVDDRLPRLAGSDVGLLVMEAIGTVDGEQIEKLVPEVGARVIAVEVSGAPGYWIEGEPHVMRYRDPSGATGQLVSRLVGDVLVWQRGSVLFRIESALGYEETLRIAESMVEAAP
jgi:hypothetical protein